MDTQSWRRTLQRALRGDEAHMTPLQAADRLVEAGMDLTLPGVPYSARQCLYHLMYWAELLADAAAGRAVTWPRDLALSWQVPPELRGPGGTQVLVYRLLAALDRAQAALETAELAASIPDWPGATVGWAYQVLAIHNSYHLGQLVVLLRATGSFRDPAAPNPV